MAVLLASVIAGMVLHAIDPDLPPSQAFEGLPALLAGGVAASGALGFTTFIATRGMAAARLRLVPGRERGLHLLVMVAGMLALGQMLDSLATLTGVANHGALEIVRRALTGISGPELFAAVFVVGVLAGAAEEVFFRGYMQSLLRERWRAGPAIAVSSACFGILHLDPVLTPLAFVLGIYLGFVAEVSGSALPAATCHVVNNVIFTLTTALGVAPAGRAANAVIGVACIVVVVASVVWLRRSLRSWPA